MSNTVLQHRACSVLSASVPERLGLNPYLPLARAHVALRTDADRESQRRGLPVRMKACKSGFIGVTRGGRTRPVGGSPEPMRHGCPAARSGPRTADRPKSGWRFHAKLMIR